MRNKIFILFTTFALLSFQTPKEKVRLFIAGDSTAQTYKENETLMRGWGQMLQHFFTDEVKVVNHAIGGRSTKTFIGEGRWDSLLGEIQPGDYVIIQFGHNDASTRPERHTSYVDYKQNLIQFVNETRAKGGNPILATSIVMRTFKDGNLIDDRLKAYPAVTRMVAGEYNVPLIDANVVTRDLVLMLGDEASKPFYRWLGPGVDKSKPEGVQDDTHMNELGANQVAMFIAEGIQKLNLKGLSEYVELGELIPFTTITDSIK